VGVGSHNLKIRLIESLADMKFLARSHTRLQRPASLLKWHHWFAWYPVVVRVNDELKHWVWLERLERKWSISKNGDQFWRYRDPVAHLEQSYADTPEDESTLPPSSSSRTADTAR
jgi:hypothetical protein